MTPEEKRAQMQQRDAAIVAYYQEGRKLSECASRFRLGRQRVLQILKRADAWRPYVKKNRTNFLGVSISDATKEALRRESERRGVSMSSLSDEAIQKMLAEIGATS